MKRSDRNLKTVKWKRCWINKYWERVKFHNGKVKIVSAGGMGTSVVIQMPIDAGAKAKKAELLLFDFND